MGGRTSDEGDGFLRRGIQYKSLPSQRKFHRSKARFKGFSGPIGSGKSQALVQEAIRLSYVNAGRTGLIGAPTYPMLRDATMVQLVEVLKENNLPFELNKSEFFIKMKDTGSKILMRSLDEFERLRGTNLAWFGVDELSYCVEEAWLRLEGRLRDPKAKELCGFAVWTPKGFDWVYKKFIAEPPKGYEVIRAAAFENRHILDQIPDFYDRLKQSYDERFFAQEVMGQYLSTQSNTVYHCFDRGINVKPMQVHRRLPLLWALDFNIEPMCSVVAQMWGDELHVVDELQLQRASTEDACMEFIARYGNHPMGIIIYGDAAGNTMQTTSGSSDYKILQQVLKREGVENFTMQIRNVNPLVRDRVQLVNSLLRSAAGESHLFVDPKCKELIKDFEQVTYQKDSMQLDKATDYRRTHLSDALGYLLWLEKRPQTIGHQNRRLV